jgi:GTP-binding protein LepA
MEISKIRNFAIIAHIDHGKSTLADRFLEITETIPKNKMKEQTLDSMDLERERGITIKLQPVRMKWKDYELNLIDTPGHVDFTYEVSRSLAAVEGALLVVDATQGIQAQTLTNLHLAKEQDLKIIPILNKIDLPGAEIERVKAEIVNLLGVREDEILLASGKEGTGVEEILDKIIEDIPAPKEIGTKTQALIFDSVFDIYKGVVAFVRLKGGSVKKGDKIKFMVQQKTAEAIEVGYFSPTYVSVPSLTDGEVGYIVTGLKDVSEAKVGDTITIVSDKERQAEESLPGYKQLNPFVYASIYSTTGEPNELREALEKLTLNDSSLTFEAELSPALGSGFRVGFLGLLHLDIIRERLEREFNQDLIITTPSVSYKINYNGGKSEIIKSAQDMPEAGTYESVEEPMVNLEIVTPNRYLGPVMELAKDHRGEYVSMDYLDTETALLLYEIPLSEIIVDFYDDLKSVSSGYASLNYEFTGFKKGELVKLDIIVGGDIIPPLATIVPREKSEKVGRNMVKKLKETVPRQNFAIPLQAAISAKIIAREDIPPFRKDVTAKLYGGDVTRKRKLLEKQKKGKKRLKRFGRVDIPQEAFMAVLKK